ncbi:MAG TPA: hypothetical protein VMZ28_18090 [Kofleriaceae bacterium]|nr:hypothetical protein [Kofleriaceae bacterium]
MTKKTRNTNTPQPPKKGAKLAVKREILRKLDVKDLDLVAGGIHCAGTVPWPK